MVAPSTNGRLSAAHNAGLWRGERGMISAVNLTAILLCTVLMGLVINVGHVVHQKIELQNAADATAYTAALWHARGMNAITATNHVIGEITAFIVMHRAIGGDKLDRRDTANTSGPDSALDVAHAAATLAAPFAYDVVREREGLRVDEDSMLYDAKVQLKYALAVAYGAKAAGIAMQSNPFTFVAGVILVGAMHVVEGAILAEYVALKGIHVAASTLKPAMKALEDTALPFLNRYTSGVRMAIHNIASRAAVAVADENHALGDVFPGILQPLPVEEDPYAKQLRQRNFRSLSETEVAKRSQLTRATYPWVVYHRTAILGALRFLFISGARGHYRKWSNEYTLRVCKSLQATQRIGLLVMDGRRNSADDKGRESWTSQQPVAFEADRRFTFVGFAHRGGPKVVSETIYAQEGLYDDGMAAFAQAMFYNANPQRPEQPGGSNQRQIGWDTLNWVDRPPEWQGGDSEPPASFPKIKLNWQAKLVPVTRTRIFPAVTLQTNAQISDVLARTSVQRRRLTTH